MRNTILNLLGVIFITSSINAQSIQNRRSALTMQYAEKEVSKLDSKLVFSEIANQTYVSAFIKVNSNFHSNSLTDLGVLIGTVAGNIITIKIPIDQVKNVIQLQNGIEFIQLDQPVYTNLEAARAKTNVDMVHNGTSLPQGYSGKDVVVGVLDVGFDYSHPTFYDENGVNYRIKRVWEQKTNGTPPSNYSYGHEITDTLAMLVQQTDNNGQSHGTHVAGIAAGSGFGGTANEYKGVAYESDLVLVGITPASNQWTNTGMTDIIDGLNYIYDYAASVNKPAVANLSWGCTIGPHDGNSLFSQAVNNLTGPGKIFTISAGNNGGTKLHISKDFTSTDTLLQSFAQISLSPAGKKTWIDIWGEQNETFCVELTTYVGVLPQNSTSYFCVDNSNLDTFILGSDGDTLYINATTSTADVNGKPHIFLDLYSKTSNRIALKIKGNSGEVHAWMGYVHESSGIYGSFISYNLQGFVTGNDEMTIGEMACTESAITVAAYASKNTFTNISGQGASYATYVATDDICPFSSHGPTLNWYTKPDITAPGMTIASAVNSYDANYTPGGGSYGSVVHGFTDPGNSQQYYFGEMSGTSMSSPMVAGIVALVLEANPNATPQEIKMLMKYTAIKDGFTTPTPESSIWGDGKIDAYGMLFQIDNLGLADAKAEFNAIYPNPFSDYVVIDFNGHKKAIITNNVGQICLNAAITGNKLDTKSLASGTYFIAVYNENSELIVQQKLVKF
jgi:minor extracellular serine protease Vpr